MSTSRSSRAERYLEPSRIALARQRAGLTKASLAHALSVTARTVSGYESAGAPARCAPALARALGCTEQFLVRGPIDELEEDRVFFRARRRASALQRHAATAAGRMGIEFYEWIDTQFRLPDPDLPELDHTDPGDAAEALRAVWGLGMDPAPNLVQLAESRGVRVVGLPPGAEEVDAFSVWSNGRPYVFLSLSKTPERSRFDLAHELGHLLLHSRNDSDAGVEKEANAFASAFLMPRRALRTGIRRDPSAAEIVAVKSHFRVSAMALTYALHEDGRLSDWGYRQNCIRLAEMGYRTGEPHGMSAHESSRVFRVVFDHLRREHAMSTDDVGQVLGLSAQDVHALSLGTALYGLPVTSDTDNPHPPAASAPRPALQLLHGQGRTPSTGRPRSRTTRPT